MNFSKKHFFLVTGSVLVVYFLNCFTPLRITFDTARYFNITESLESAPNNHAATTDFFPHGYPYFLLLLSKLHIARSFFICFIQLLYFLGAWWFIKKIFGRSINFNLLIILGLLNWSSMKLVITPLSEMQYIFFSTGFLYFLNALRERSNLRYIFLAVLFAALAIFTRTIGIILLLTGAVVILIDNRQAIKALLSKKWTWVPLLLVAAGIAYAAYNKLGVADYLDFHAGYFKPIIKSPLHYLYSTTNQHAADLAALLLNIPAPKLVLSPMLAICRDALYLVIALLFLAWMIYMLLFRKSLLFPLTLRIYVLLYTLFILCWPLSEPRLWVPIFPFFIVVLLQIRLKPGSLPKKLSVVIRTIYIFLGILALGYYSYTSFNKAELAANQDAGFWYPEYEVYFFNRSLGETTRVPRKDVIDMLKKYN